MGESNPFYSDSRWNNMYAYAATLQDLIQAGGDPVEESIMTLSLVLQQFPESPPLDEESHHVNCVNALLRNVLGALRKYKLDEARKERK
ncbi:hypothetical protein [Paucidesulfovibrio longus]|jgi:hypothetical protein|uniref:hypothetical protein n=1 Tax=Paucidesulfovibrio longus TaxID=889 RepID=UPI0003B553F3|nr:hypothetical protein [Paucidesulfovibrio longus]